MINAPKKAEYATIVCIQEIHLPDIATATSPSLYFGAMVHQEKSQRITPQVMATQARERHIVKSLRDVTRSCRSESSQINVRTE